MKTTLLTFLCLTLCLFHKAQSQPCTLANVQLEKAYTGADGKCYADLYFDMDRNSGNKFIYLHVWTKDNFLKVNKDRFTKGAGPKGVDINGTVANPHPALATLAIDNNDYAAPVWNSSNYRPDASVPVVKGGSLQVSAAPVSGSGSNPLYRYSIKAVPLGLTGSCDADNLDLIVWSTQSSAVNSQIHCALTGLTEQPMLEISGSVNCKSAKYSIGLINSTKKAITGSVDVYAGNGHRPNDDNFDPANERHFDAVSYFLVEPNQTISIDRPIPAKYLGYSLFAQVSLSNGNTQVKQIASGNCGNILPVKLQSFTANRSRQQVAVKWSTASEQDVQGFNLLRQTANNEWKVIAFVPTQAAGGNSSQTLTYQYTDLNAFKGISQYRLQEVSTGGKTSLSEIKMVRGEEQPSKLTLFPNPSVDGRASLVFDNASVRDIRVVDMSGRTVKQLNGITNTNITIDNLKSGFYNVQVIDRVTNEIVIEKLIVKTSSR